MAFKLHTRIAEVSITEGTGAFLLLGALDGCKRFSSEYADGDTLHYVAEPEAGGTEYEFGIGTYSANTLTRTTVIGSSNGDAAVSWLNGRKIISVSPIAPSDLTPSQLATYLSTLGLLPGRNLLHNGGFQIAQRGNGPFTSASTFVNNDDSYLLDGCIFLANGADTCDVSRLSVAGSESGHRIRLDVETANRRFGIFFPIEQALAQKIIYSGKASVQFKVEEIGTLTNVRAYLLSWSGTADTITSDPISAWNAAGADPTFAASWTAENVGSNIAIAGDKLKKIEDITVDTANVKNLGLLIISDATTTTVGDILDIMDVQVEEGRFCTPYEHRPIAVDLALCQRYYEISSTPVGMGFSGRVVSGNAYLSFTTFKATKRVTPTVALTNLNASAFPASSGSSSVSPEGLLESRTANATTDNGFYHSSWRATAEL